LELSGAETHNTSSVVLSEEKEEEWEIKKTAIKIVKSYIYELQISCKSPTESQGC
jgi:hypothetical protein